MKLTEREKEIMNLVIEGYTNKQIANILCVTVSTVKKHLEHIFDVNNVSNRIQATVKYIKDNCSCNFE